MKKYFLFCFIIVSISIASCKKKCVECGNCPTGITLDKTTLCRDDFASQDEYDQAVAVTKAFGCDCK